MPIGTERTPRYILSQVKAAIRQPYAFPGCYPVYTVLSDGVMLCPTCARSEYRQIASETRAPDSRSGWEAIGVDILWEQPEDGGEETCGHCGDVLPSAYGD